MIYGKLLVYLPDGTVEEHPLTKEVTSIGRQPGNDIVIATISVSRYHAQIIARQGHVFIIDLETVNNTYVNDVAIASGEEVQLKHGDEIAMGDARIVFSASDEGEGDTTAARREPTTVIEGHAPLRVALDEPHQSVAPGARLRLEMVIENPSDETQQYVISLSGMEPGWVRANRREVRLNPGEQSEVIISVQPPRSSQTIPGTYPLVVTIALKDDPSLFLEATREIDVVGYTGLGMVVREGRQLNSYQIAVQNQGNIPTRIRLGGFHRARKLRFAFDRVDLDMTPGQTEQVGLVVRPHGGRPFGHSERTNFAVVARSLDAANYQAPVSTAYTITPSWSAWAAGAIIPIGGLLVLLTLAAVLVFALGIVPFGQSGEPTLSGTSIVVPGPTNIIFTATPTPKPGDTTPESNVTEGTPTATSTVTPTVGIPPVEATAQPSPIIRFDVTPVHALIHQVGDVTVSWEVAEGVTASSVTRTNPNPEDEPVERFLQEGEMSYSIPISELAPSPGVYTYTLYAASAEGTYSEAATFEVVAECRVTSDIVVFGLPDLTTTVGALAGDDSVVPLAQAAGYPDLVQVSYAGATLQGWVRRDAIECEGIQDMNTVTLEEWAGS
jgi:hypothetical protein